MLAPSSFTWISTFKFKTLISNYCICVNISKLFNALPFDLRNYDGSAEAFKSRLDKFLAEVPDKPSLPAYHQPATNNSIIEQLAVLRAAGIQPY